MYWVDHKLGEADFFLEMLEAVSARHPEAQPCSVFRSGLYLAQYYMSAFLSACRSVTYALQATMGDCPGFEEWYRARQEALASDRLARFLRDVRNEGVHVGVSPLAAVVTDWLVTGARTRRFFRDKTGGSQYDPPSGYKEVTRSCRSYLRKLMRLVWECYRDFAQYLDPRQCYTEEKLLKMGWSIEDAEESVGLERGATAGHTDAERLASVRSQVHEPYVWPLFRQYLGRGRPRTWR